MAQLKSGTRIYGDATVDGRLGLGTNNNIRIGNVSTGSSITSGTHNFFAGASAGVANTSGSNNFFVGLNAGCNITSGSCNNFLGNGAGQGVTNPVATLTAVTFPTVLAAANLTFNNVSATSNGTGSGVLFTVIRNASGAVTNIITTNGGSNYQVGSILTILGSSVGGSAPADNITLTINSVGVTGSNNNFFGNQAGRYNTLGSCNNFFGNSAGRSNTTGSNNNFFGLYSGCLNTTGCHNNFFGVSSGRTNTTGRYNNYFGFLSGSNNNGSFNNFIGVGAGRSTTNAGANNFFGFYAGKGFGVSVTGGDNNFFGFCAGFNFTSGSCNNFLGCQTGFNNSTGNHNNFFGFRSGCSNTSGSNNNFFGQNAGCTQTSGDNNIAIGNSVQLPITTGSNQLAIGSGSTAWISGNVTGISSYNVGIGTTNPSQTLHVQGNARVTGFIIDSTGVTGSAGQVLQSTVTGTQWTTAAAGGGGSGKFDTSIDNVIYVQPTGTLDIVGVGTTVTQITTLPSGSNKYLVHSLHVTNISNGDAEITAGFVMNARKVPATITVGGGAGINTITVGSASSIIVGMAVTGQGNIGETTGIGSTAGFQYNTYVTSVDGTRVTLSKPIAGQAVSGTAWFSPVSKVSSRLPVPVGSAVELLKQPMILNALDSIVLQSTGAGTGIGTTSTAAISQTANSNILTVTAGAAITNFLTSGMLIAPTGTNTGIQTNTFVGVGYTPGSLFVPMTRPAITSVASTSLSFTEVVTPQDGALQVTVVYQSSTDTSYLNGTGTVSAASSNTTSVTAGLSTIPVAYYGTGNSFPSIIQSIRVSNISDGSIYPGGDYPVSVGIGNSDTIFSWLAYNMAIPKNSSIELCEAPKRIGIGQSIFAITNTPYAIEIQVAGKQKTS